MNLKGIAGHMPIINIVSVNLWYILFILTGLHIPSKKTVKL